MVSEYINQHTSTNITTRNAKEVLGKAKELLHSDQHMREAANKHAYQSLEKSQTKPSISDSTASQRFDSKYIGIYCQGFLCGMNIHVLI